MSFKRFLIAPDQAANTLVKLSDGYGYPDEMLSSRAWRLREDHPWLQKSIVRLFFWDTNHCQECFDIEMNREQLPKVYRNRSDE